MVMLLAVGLSIDFEEAFVFQRTLAILKIDELNTSLFSVNFWKTK
jgi:hypothetical protein